MPKGEHFRGKKPEGSGRKVGSVAKTTLALRESLGSKMDSAVARLLEIANTTDDEDLAARATSMAMPYFYPKLSAISIEQDKDAEPTTINVRFIEPTTQADGD
jgi:hypothetical protein